MNERELKDAVNKIHTDISAKQRIINAYENKNASHGKVFRRSAMGLAACVLVFGVLFSGMLFPISQGPSTQAPETDCGLTLKVSAGGMQTVELKKGIDVVLLSGDCFGYETREINGQKVKIVAGMTAPDFTIDGTNIESVTYTAKNGSLFCEYNSYDHDENGKYIWSGTYALASVEEYKEYTKEIYHPTKQELISILEDLHSKGDLAALYHTIYTEEYAKTEEPKGILNDKAEKAFREKCLEPINFSKFTLSSKIIESNGQDTLEISVVNPEHPPVLPVESKSISTTDGDTVSWYITGNSILNQEVFGQKAEDVDYTKIHDEINIAVTFKDGTTKEYIALLQFSSAGEMMINFDEM